MQPVPDALARSVLGLTFPLEGGYIEPDGAPYLRDRHAFVIRAVKQMGPRVTGTSVGR